MRQAGDYQKSAIITKEQAIYVLQSAEEFIKISEDKIAKK
jgi:uncharacterized protein (UPF0332 family)